MEGIFENNLDDNIISNEKKIKKESFKFWLAISIFGVFIFLIIVLSIIILSILGPHKNNKENKTSPLHNINQTGKIQCYYDIKNTSENIQLLNKDFQNNNMIYEIYINDTKINYTNNFKFSSEGIYSIEYKIKGRMNLKYMFKNILSLISFEIISTCNKSLIIEEIEGLFENCKKLKEVKLNDINTTNIKSLSKLFYNNKKLTKVEMNEIITDNVINMSYLFYNCESLKKLNFSNFNTSSLKDVSHMFENCYSLKSLNLNSFSTSSVINMSFFFFRV